MSKKRAWLCLRLGVTPLSRAVVENFLYEAGCLGCEERESTILAYFTNPFSRDELEGKLSQFLVRLQEMDMPAGDPVFHVLEEEDWGAAWKQYFKPVRIGSGFLITPPWHHPLSFGRRRIIINPALAFGTGTHETTQLVLELLEEEQVHGARVLDCGTGSAILAIAAARLGASSITAFDIDEDALANARENLKRNHTEDAVILVCGGPDGLKETTYDLILANINSTVLKGLFSSLRPRMEEASRLILSGILISEEDDILHSLKQADLQVEKQRRKGEWLALVTRPAV